MDFFHFEKLKLIDFLSLLAWIDLVPENFLLDSRQFVYICRSSGSRPTGAASFSHFCLANTNSLMANNSKEFEFYEEWLKKRERGIYKLSNDTNHDLRELCRGRSVFHCFRV